MNNEPLVNGALPPVPGEQQRPPAGARVVGVGGGGGKCVLRMLEHGRLPGASFALISTDAADLESGGPGVDLVHLGEKPGPGRALDNAGLVVIAAGMGGRAGSVAAPRVARHAREMGALVVAVVTIPFTFEGARRRAEAHQGIDRLRPWVDSLVVIHGDRLLGLLPQDAAMSDAFRAADDVVARGIRSVLDLANAAGECNEYNAAPADVKTVLSNPGGALLAVGSGYGRTGPAEAAASALARPLWDRPIESARGVLFTVRGGGRLAPPDLQAVRRAVTGAVGRDARVLSALIVDESLGEEVQLTLIATGLEEDASRRGAAPSGRWRQRQEAPGPWSASPSVEGDPGWGLSGRGRG